MFAYEPDLQLIGPQYITDDYIVGAIIPQGGSQFRQFPAVANDDLVRVQQPGKLHRNLLPALGRPLDSGSFRHIVGHCYAETAEQLNPLSDGVDKLRLLTEMLVEKQMKLIESRTGDLPMRFLVQIAQGHGVGE